METANNTALKSMQPKLTKVAKEVAKNTSGYLNTVILVLKWIKRKIVNNKKHGIHTVLYRTIKKELVRVTQCAIFFPTLKTMIKIHIVPRWCENCFSPKPLVKCQISLLSRLSNRQIIQILLHTYWHKCEIWFLNVGKSH